MLNYNFRIKFVLYTNNFNISKYKRILLKIYSKNISIVNKKYINILGVFINIMTPNNLWLQNITNMIKYLVMKRLPVKSFLTCLLNEKSIWKLTFSSHLFPILLVRHFKSYLW